MVTFMKKIIKSNEHKVAVEKSKVESIKIVTTEATRDSDNKKNNCDVSSNAKNIQTASSNEHSSEKLHMIDFIKQEEASFIEQSITIKDEMLPVTDDSIDVDKMNNSNDHSIGLGMNSNEISNSYNNNNQSCSNKVIDNIKHQKNTRLSTGSLAPKKYSFCDEISFQERARVVKLATENPTWSLSMLRKHSGCKNIHNYDQVGVWKKQIQQGGSNREKKNCMEEFDKHQFKEIDQQLFTDLFNACWELLKSKEYYLCQRETNIFSKMSLNYGHDMFEAMVIFMKKIIISNKHKAVIKKSKVASIKIVTAETSRNLGYGDNYNQQQQVDKEEASFIEQSITIQDEMLPVTDDSIDVDKMNNSNDHSIGLGMNSNGISSSYNNNNQSCSNKVIDNVDHQKNTRISTGSLARKKYSVYTGEDDELSSTTDEKYYDDDDDDVNCLNQNENLEDKIKIIDGISFEEKTRVIKLAIENPNWSLDLLREHSGYNDKNNFDDSSKAGNIQIASSNENSIDKLHMLDFIKKEEELFTEQSITIKDELLSITDDSLDADEINNSHDHSIGLKIESNKISNLFKNNHQSCSNEVIENVEHQRNTRIRTGSLAPKKYSFYTEEDDDLSSTTDKNDLDDDDDNGNVSVDADDDADDDVKTRVVELATENPTWSLNMLRKHSGCKNIDGRRQIEVWEEHIEQGGSYRERMIFLNNCKKKSSSYLRVSVPYDIKVRVVNLANKNPRWSLKMLREGSGCKNLETMNQLNYWKKVMEEFDKHQFKKIDQQLFTESFNACWELLKSKEYYLCQRETNIFSKMSLNYGHDMFEAMVIFMKKIIISNKHKAVIKKSKVASIKIVTAETSRNLGYGDNYNQQQQVDKEKKLFTEQSITIKDEMLSITDDSIDVDKMNNSNDHSIGLEIKSNEISNLFNGNNQSCSNKVIDNLDHQKNTRISTGSLARKKYSVYTGEDDELSSTTDDNYSDDDDVNCLNQNENLEDKIKIIDDISFEEKTRVVKLASENPSWSLDSLREHSGCPYWLTMFKKNYEITGKPNNLRIDCNSLRKESFTFSKIFVPHEIKAKIVNLANENPHWNLKMLREQSGCNNLETMNQLYRWKRVVRNLNNKRATCLST
ncbi:uncharacterized protein PFB0145c-like [Aphidius gifuensis]|uniref:uncharacterized protein PFB0145c-like n=1 Tax=Aphidius gifuensis TaxID=684658 RepID=UPI001CDCF22B|nr:uncharacterized protein PFB0145c-like [Aphidius gifuensis]